jgi:serine/threonine protein kinase
MLKTTSFDKLAGIALGNYRLERFIGQSKLGPTFLARVDASNTYLLRFVEGPLYATPREQDIYLEQFQYRARQIAALQHPYILPLFDFGIYRGVPYLVSPHIPLRSLRSRIDKHGTLNTFTVGRYLDQMTTALEYAHEHSVLHGSLSVDSIFIRLDGQLVVADFGVRSLLELNAQNLSSNQLLEQSGAYTPEQLLGKPTSPATDVYALGMVVYHLLTGSPVFEGPSFEELSRQHLYASPPPLDQARSDIPPGLYSILARALAKDPAQRYHQPGAFANAYHNSMGQTNRTRLPFVVVSEAPTAQTQQTPGTGTPAMDIPFTELTHGNALHSSGTPIQHSLHGFSDDGTLSRAGNPRAGLMSRLGHRQRQRTLLVATLVVLLVIASSALGITLFAQKGSAQVSTGGQVTFFADAGNPPGQTDALRISIQHLAAPPAGSYYDAWILNDQSETVTSLGRLTEQGQTWTLTFRETITNLLSIGDKLEITQEQGNVTTPAGKVILTGAFPVLSFQHIQHLLVAFPDTPGKVGMLIGLLQQTHLLSIQAAALQSVSASHNTVAIECLAQSMLDIIEGAHGAQYQPLSGTCTQQYGAMTGDGFGLLGSGYIAGSEEHASLALSQKDATSVMRQHAALMDVALTNITGWMKTIEQDLLNLRAHPTDLSSLPEITTLADNAYYGVDINGDGQIDPVPGEAGALIAYQQGQYMATLILTPGA